MPRQAPVTSPYDAVSFERPPVTEVALTVQFPANAVGIEQLGSFSQAAKPDLPEITYLPAAPRLTETFDAPAPPFALRLGTPFLPTRLWLASPDKVFLVQLQHDRLTLNWRAISDDVEYPRYSQIRERFVTQLDRLYTILSPIEQPIDLCEVVYVNPIEYPSDSPQVEEGTHHPDPSKIFSRLGSAPRNAFLPTPEDMHYQARWRIPRDGADTTGRPAGRLNLAVAPGLRAGGTTPIYLMTLTAHVLPEAGDRESALTALDIAHTWVVRGFKDLTTHEMHRRWGARELTGE